MDNITNEIIKYGSDVLLDKLFELYSMILALKKVSEEGKPSL